MENYTEEQRAEINEITERQYRKMLAEGKYKDLLIKFGQNGNYSVSNMLYLLSQNPDIKVENGKINISLKMILKICEVLKIEPAELFHSAQNK